MSKASMDKINHMLMEDDSHSVSNCNTRDTRTPPQNASCRRTTNLAAAHALGLSRSPRHSKLAASTVAWWLRTVELRAAFVLLVRTTQTRAASEPLASRSRDCDAAP